MTVIKIEVERFSVTSSKPFEAVVAALEATVGRPDMVEFSKAISDWPLPRKSPTPAMCQEGERVGRLMLEE